MHESGFYSIELAPLQRFKPPLSIFFDEKDGEAILDILSDVLPMEDKQPDFIDQILRYLRF
jgi:predicted ATP-grasp superfamily ATP-dependent carboligase